MKKCFLGVCAAVLSAALPASAAYIYDVDYDNGIVKARGALSGAQINRTALLAVIGGGESIEDAVFDGTNTFLPFCTDENGNFDVSFGIKEKSDGGTEYKLVISTYGGEPVYEPFYFCGSDRIMPVLKKIAQAGSASEVMAVIEDNKEIMGFMYDEFMMLNNEARGDVCDDLAERSDFENVESFRKVYYKSFLPLYLTSLSSGGEIKEALEKYEKYSGIPESGIYADFVGLSDSAKDNVYSHMADEAMTDSEDVIKAFTSGSFLELLKTTKNLASVRSLFGSYKDIIGINTSKADSLTEPGLVYNKLIGKSFASVEALQNEIDRLTAANKGSSSGGGGGGGGYGGGGGAAVGTARGLGNVASDMPEPERGEKPAAFGDLASAEWARDAVEFMYGKGIVSGYPDGTFAPSNNITREEFVKITVSAFNIDTEGAECGFEDVARTDWYYPYVSALYGLGLINGTDDGVFGAGLNITRQDAAVILYRVMKHMGAEPERTREYSPFADESRISDYALEGVKALFEAGIINGREEGFEPRAFITRAETCVMIEPVIR